MCAPRVVGFTADYLGCTSARSVINQCDFVSFQYREGAESPFALEHARAFTDQLVERALVRALKYACGLGRMSGCAWRLQCPQRPHCKPHCSCRTAAV